MGCNGEMLNYCMIPNIKDNGFKIFKQYFKKFAAYIEKDIINEFVEYINNDGIDYFYMISTDLIISKLPSEYYLNNSNEYRKYSKYINKIFNEPELNLSEVTKKLFLLYSDEQIFNKTIKKKFIEEQNLKYININQFEALLYALRFCLQSSNCENPKGFLYSQLIASDCDKNLNENYIPGNNIVDNFYVKNYALLENHLILENRPSNIGAYVCACGLYYVIAPCGFHNSNAICSNCGKNIGYNMDNPEYFRIFKDYEQRQTEFEKYDNIDKNIPNMLLEEYKKLKIDPLLDKEKLGIKKLKKQVFQNINQRIGKLSPIGFRLLNFILYSHLFYANCLGFISEEKIYNYLCDGMTCIQMLETNWNLLKEILQSKGIQIQIFINLIFEKLSATIKNCKEIKTIQRLEQFEEGIEALLEESFKEYEEYSKIYIKNNEKMLKLDKNSMKSLVQETFDKKFYGEKEYPFYKYFLMTTYPTKEDFVFQLKNIPQYERKYPLLANYIREDYPEKFLIKYLPEFNEFSNLMIDYYSYKISRKDASKRIIKEEELYKKDKNKFKQRLKSFINIWKKIKPYAVKYGLNEEMDPIDLNENKTIDYYLNDDLVLGKGMYIASAYENFIKWQNNFLDSLITQLKLNGILHHYVEDMENGIDVQKATKKETLDFDIVNQNFFHIIYENCKRNIFIKDSDINYLNYKNFIYDFEEIEKKLGKILLPGKVKFNETEKIKFVVYKNEGFLRNKSNILANFADIYKQKPIRLEKRQIIYDIIKEKYDQQNKDLINILFSLRLIIFYLIQEIQNKNASIKEIIEDLPVYVFLSKEFKEFFVNSKIKVKLEELIDFYLFFEFLCFEPIINCLNIDHKEDIEANIKKSILNIFKDKKLKIITKKSLAIACRQFISRYLANPREDFPNKDDLNLAVYLNRDEFWPKEFLNEKESFFKDIKLLQNINLTIGQCYELYNLLGIDETENLKGIKVKINLYENNSDSDEEERRIIRKRRRDIEF